MFTKAFEWEIRTTPVGVRSIGLPHGLCVELKYLDGDEFAHWTDPESFATSFRNKRKRREWEVFNALQERRGARPACIDLTAPEGTHIVDYVTREWLRAPRAPSRSAEPRTARRVGVDLTRARHGPTVRTRSTGVDVGYVTSRMSTRAEDTAVALR